MTEASWLKTRNIRLLIGLKTSSKAVAFNALILGILGILWSCLWFFMVTDSPRGHPKISRKELDYIERSLKGESESKVSNIC